MRKGKSVSFQFDDIQFQRLYWELDPRRRMRALKRGFRREATRVKKVAIAKMRNKINSNRVLERGVRASVTTKKAGFKVTIGAAKSKRNGKPVLIWLEGGTVERSTKRAHRYNVNGKWKAGANRGKIEPRRFMEETLNEVRPHVTDNIHREVINSVKEAAREYGCK